MTGGDSTCFIMTGTSSWRVLRVSLWDRILVRLGDMASEEEWIPFGKGDCIHGRWGHEDEVPESSHFRGCGQTISNMYEAGTYRPREGTYLCLVADR